MRNLLWVSLIMFLFSLNAWPQDQWLCAEDSSQIQGSQILACGVGEGVNESVARKAALKSAQDEFAAVCDTQTLCGEHKYRAIPSRSTCEKKDSGWKCYRLVKYEIENAPKLVVHNNPANFATYNTNVRDEGMDLIDKLLNKELKKELGR